MRTPDDRLTVQDIEREYGVTADAVWQWRSRGKLRPAGRLGGRGRPWLYRRHDVERVVAAHRRAGVSG